MLDGANSKCKTVKSVSNWLHRREFYAYVVLRGALHQSQRARTRIRAARNVDSASNNLADAKRVVRSAAVVTVLMCSPKEPVNKNSKHLVCRDSRLRTRLETASPLDEI